MNITVQKIPHASRLVDTTAVLNNDALATLKACGVDGTIRYFETLTPDEVAWHMNANLGLCIVGYARAPRSWTPSPELGDFDAARSLAKVDVLAMSLGFDPAGLVHWCDLEGAAGTVEQVSGYLTSFGGRITNATHKGIGGVYVGDDQPLSGVQLFSITTITAYWRAFNAVLPDIPVGYQMVQLYKSVPAPGGLPFEVDYDFTQYDAKGRQATWLKAVA